MTPEDLSKLAFLLYPHIARPEPDRSSIESLADRVKAIQRGLLPEDELAATVCWLGNCAGIHRIGQTPIPVPDLTAKMRAPDFLAFPMMGDQPIPVLIEVKSHHGTHLDWSENYLLSLRRFAERLNLPLLVAWKCGDIWTLVDSQHFEKNVTAYRLTLERAFREDLLCVLFRNLRIQMNTDLEMILDMQILDEIVDGPDCLIPAGDYHMQIVDAGFYCRGVEITEYQPQHFWLFLTTPDEVDFRRTGKQDCRQIFRPLPEHGFTLSNVLVAQLSLRNASDTLNWHVILTQSFPSSGRELRESLQAAIDCGFVRYVMDIIPNTWPTFLPDEKQWMAAKRTTDP